MCHLFMTKVLVVDDDRIFRLLLREYLERRGWDVIESDSGRDVLDQITTEQPDYCFLDLVMKDVDGFVVLQQLLNQSHKPEVFVCSAHEDYLGIAEVFPFAHTFPKPIDFNKLTEALNRLEGRDL